MERGENTNTHKEKKKSRQIKLIKTENRLLVDNNIWMKERKKETKNEKET